MSRFRRLKEERMKNILKAISCALALSLIIGSVQGLDTYALFTDTEDIASNLAISTGDVDVKVSEGQTITELAQGINFSITNQGTLNQNISLKITTSGNLSKYLESIAIYLGPELNPNIDISSIDEIKLNSYTELKKQDNKTLFVLSPGETIEGYMMLDISSDIPVNTKYDLNLQVKASQTNKSATLQSGGFYDEDIQKNTIKINNKNSIILEDYTTALVESGGSIYIDYNVIGGAKGLIEAIDQLDGTLRASDGQVVSLSGSEAFSNANYREEDKWPRKGLTISNVSKGLIQYSYGIGNYINIEFKYSKELTKFYRIDFRRDGFIIPSIEAKVTEISREEFMKGNTLTQIQVLQDIEESNRVVSPKEDIQEIQPEITEQVKDEEVSVEQEVADITKEDILEPSKEDIQEIELEITEQVKDEEVSVEQEVDDISKENVLDFSNEETQLPSEEVIQPSTEEVEAPSEIEVVDPQKEETEIE